MDDGLGRFSFQAREAIQGIIDGFADGAEFNGQVLAEGLKHLHHLDDEVPEILEAVMVRGGLRAQLFAALAMIKGAENFPRMAEDHQEIVKLAKTTVLTAFENARDRDSLEVICGMIGRIGAVPDCAVSVLEKLVGEDGERPIGDVAAAYAATALTWASVGESKARALQRLVRILSAGNIEATLVAAPTLLLNDWQSDRAVDALLQLLPDCNWMVKCGLVRLLRDVGPRGIRLLPMLREVFADRSISSTYRGQALAAIGSVAKGSSEDVNVLSGALLSEDWEIVNGAIEGLAMHGSVKEPDTMQLATHLSAENPQLRFTAASNLQRLGPLGRPALQPLLARLGEESDAEICKLVAAAIASVGMDAIDPLIDEAQRLDFRTFPLVALSLKTIGDDAIGPVVEKLLGDENEQIQALGILVLRDMGSRAAPAVPVLTGLLRQTRDLEMAVVLLQTIALCGRAAESAIDAIVEVLISCEDQDVEDHATRTLQRLGPAALRTLENAVLSATGGARQRLNNAIAALKRRVDDRYLYFETLNNDNLLRYFVLVGQCLERRGTTSWTDIGEAIEPYVAAFRIRRNELGTSPNAVRDNVQRLVKLLQRNPLTTHGGQRAGDLTAAGRKLLAEATEYLRGVYGTAPEFDG